MESFCRTVGPNRSGNVGSQVTRITLTPAQLARAEKNGGHTVEVPHEKAKKAPRQKAANSSRSHGEASNTPEGDTGTIEGIFGSRVHRWMYQKSVTGWLTVCLKIQMHHRPKPGGGDEEKCEGCFDE